MKIAILVSCIFACFNSFAGDVFTKFPSKVDTTSLYVFYSHGYIVEGKNKTPKHSRWGVYEYPAILSKLTSSNTHVISEHRRAKSDPVKHAKKLAKQAKRLIKKGVPAKNITFVGFSRGGLITAITSTYLANENINYVILAACTSGIADQKEITIHGALLSIYEASDSVGSCESLMQKHRDTITSYKELVISTGEEHGAFYRPIDEWVEPVNQWIQRAHE